jgi:hypothetical protein
MATIIAIDTSVPDGIDVDVVLSDGNTHRFHFLELPNDLQATVNTLEEEILPPVITIIVESGEVINA